MHKTHIEKLNELEENGLWDEVLNYSMAHRDDEDVLVRVIFYGWYLKLEYDCVKNCTEIIGNKANKNLANIFDVAINSKSFKVLSEIGYGMNIVSYCFPGDTGENEKNFPTILQKAYDLSCNDVVCAVLLNGAGVNVAIECSETEYESIITARYNGSGEYNAYYRSVLINRMRG